MSNIQIELNKNEALVFFDVLSKFNNNDYGNDVVIDKAEQIVFWNIEAQLEKLLPEVFDENYEQLLLIAKNNINHPD